MAWLVKYIIALPQFDPSRQRVATPKWKHPASSREFKIKTKIVDRRACPEPVEWRPRLRPLSSAMLV